MLEISSLSIKSILAGIGLNLLASIILSAIVAYKFAATSGILMKNKSEFQPAFQSSFNVRLALLAICLVTSFFMGIVAEWLAPTPPLVNATVCGGLLLFYHLAMVYLKPDAAPAWSRAIIILGVVPLSTLGGWVVGII